MILVGKKKVIAFCRQHADACKRLNSWILEVEQAEWTRPQDIKERYPHASLLAENRVIFNIRGPNYRLDAAIDYETKTVVIMRIGTHEEYDKWKF